MAVTPNSAGGGLNGNAFNCGDRGRVCDINQNAGWRPRDTFARITDGTSNTIVIGEKHITPRFLSKCCANGNRQENPANPALQGRDGFPYWSGDQDRSDYWLAGHVNFPLARSATEGEGLAWPTANNNPSLFASAPPALGSWHPGVCNFLFLDGSVHALSVSTPPAVLRHLGIVNDGQVIDLP